MSERSLFYDRAGLPIDATEWGKLQHIDDYRIVCRTSGDEWTVSTVWLGIDHAWSGGPPVIFETMIIGGPHEGEITRYATEAAALAGHDQALSLVRDSARR